MNAILFALILLCALGGSVLFMARICEAYGARWPGQASRIGKWMMLAAAGGLVVLAVSGCGTRASEPYAVPVVSFYSLWF